MRRRRRQRGQALVEYAFLFVMLATIGIAVVALAGSQLFATYQDVEASLAHLGNDVSGPTQFVCPDGTLAVLHGHNYHCR